ncbi:MAG: hypothetical protein H8D97_00550 [Proteobacteria bacterium]|nr:hypothetical protein [Pseudomonadota bacterium]
MNKVQQEQIKNGKLLLNQIKFHKNMEPTKIGKYVIIFKINGFNVRTENWGNITNKKKRAISIFIKDGLYNELMLFLEELFLIQL